MRYLAKTILATAVLALAACTTNKAVIPEDASAKELIQRGQEAYEKNRTKDALAYYTAVVDRYGSDSALYIEARYEIAHLYMRKKNYDNAVPILEEITEMYASSPVGTFPASYQKLAQLELAKVPEEQLAAIHERQYAQAEQAARKQEALQRQAQAAELQAQLQQYTETPAAEPDASETDEANETEITETETEQPEDEMSEVPKTETEQPEDETSEPAENNASEETAAEEAEQTTDEEAVADEATAVSE